MIRHIVLFSAKQHVTTQQIIDGLMMLEDIGEHRHFEVKPNLKRDSVDNEVDVVFYSEFEDEAALNRFVNHPTYQQCIDVVKPNRELRYCVDIES